MKFNEQVIIEEFEKRFAKFVQTRYAVSLNSGFSALLVSLKAHGIGPGDEVIIPDYTFIATATAVSLAGATPVFVDVGEDALINPDLIQEKITIRTKAIIAVHLYARRAAIEKINKIAKENKLQVIEDCAEAIGAPNVGIVDGCWSFHYAKTISTEQGGMITTNNYAFAEKCRQLAGYCKDPLVDYLHTDTGYNFRMTSMQAEMGLKALETIKQKLERMRKAGKKLAKKYGEKHQKNYWVFVSSKLKEFDRGGFVPMHLQPPYRCIGSFPVSEKLHKELKYKFL